MGNVEVASVLPDPRPKLRSGTSGESALLGAALCPCTSAELPSFSETSLIGGHYAMPAHLGHSRRGVPFRRGRNPNHREADFVLIVADLDLAWTSGHQAAVYLAIPRMRGRDSNLAA